MKGPSPGSGEGCRRCLPIFRIRPTRLRTCLSHPTAVSSPIQGFYPLKEEEDP